MQHLRKDSPYHTYTFEILILEDPLTLEKFLLTMSDNQESIKIIQIELWRLIIKSSDMQITIPFLNEKIKILFYYKE
jgi:NADH:ubiquinone oxidoreductase subunit D